MRYRFHTLPGSQFEDIVLEICRELLGPSVSEFVSAKDYHRDAIFTGTAEDFPTNKDPLSGITVIQAKHTTSEDAKFSDSEFSGDGKGSLLSREIQRLRAFREASGVDNYLLFANRRLTPKESESITRQLIEKTGVPRVLLFGTEQIEKYAKKFFISLI